VAFASRKHKRDPAEIVAAAFSKGKLREPLQVLRPPNTIDPMQISRNYPLVHHRGHVTCI